jgi:hypothetical protein
MGTVIATRSELLARAGTHLDRGGTAVIVAMTPVQILTSRAHLPAVIAELHRRGVVQLTSAARDGQGMAPVSLPDQEARRWDELRAEAADLAGLLGLTGAERPSAYSGGPAGPIRACLGGRGLGVGATRACCGAHRWAGGTARAPGRRRANGAEDGFIGARQLVVDVPECADRPAEGSHRPAGARAPCRHHRDHPSWDGAACVSGRVS